MKIFDIRKLLFLSSSDSHFAVIPVIMIPSTEYLPSLAVSCFKTVSQPFQFPCIVIHQIARKKNKNRI